jgi:cyanate permease
MMRKTKVNYNVGFLVLGVLCAIVGLGLQLAASILAWNTGQRGSLVIWCVFVLALVAWGWHFNRTVLRQYRNLKKEVDK